MICKSLLRNPELRNSAFVGIFSEQRDMLCEDLAHATEQLNMLTEASKKHSALLQSAQEELTRKEARIQELQHEVTAGEGAAPDGAWGRPRVLLRSLPWLTGR